MSYPPPPQPSTAHLYLFILIMWQLVTRCEFKCHIPPPPQPSTAHLPDHTAVFSSGRDRLQFSNHFFYSIITNIANGKYRTKSKTLVLHKIIRKFAQNKQENKQANRQTNKQTENSITEATLIPCGSSGGAGQLHDCWKLGYDNKLESFIVIFNI